MKPDLFQLCTHKKWSEVRKYLSSDATEEKKKSNIMYCNDYGTCLHIACCRDAPDDIIKAMLDIGGKELIMKKYRTALHWACVIGASYNIIKILIDVGGKDLVMAKDTVGDTALHDLCWNINSHTKVAEKIKLMLQIGDANLILSAKNRVGNTPLKITTDSGASNIIKKLLTLQSTTTSTRSNNRPSTNIVPADNGTPITQSSKDHQTTRRSSTNNDPTIPIRGLAIEQNHQSQLREAEEKAKTIQQDFDQKCIEYSDLEENYQSQLKIAKEQILQIHQDYDQKCADCCQLKEENQVECTENLQLVSALDMLKKELYQCRRMKVDLDKKVEAQEGEVADLEATVETQRLEIADLTDEKDGIEKEYMDKVDKLTRALSKEQAELQLLKNKSSSEVEVGMKRKRTNEEHEEGEGTVVQSQTQSSEMSRIGNAADTGSVATGRSQAYDDDFEMITKELLYERDKYTKLMNRYLQSRREL
eukprot:scaffold5222_cov282-Chaetoceros_neogracile.AAC.27